MAGEKAQEAMWYRQEYQRLTAEVDTLRIALQHIADLGDENDLDAAIELARTALGQPPKPTG